MTDPAQPNNNPNLDDSNPPTQNLGVSQWRTQIEEIIDSCGIFGEEVRISKPDGTSYITSDTSLLVNSLLALLATVQAETDRESRIDELRNLSHYVSNDDMREVSMGRLEDRLAALNQKAGRDE